MKNRRHIQSLRIQKVNRLDIAGHVEGADIGAERIAEVDQRRLGNHLRVGHRLALGVQERERPADVTPGDLTLAALRNGVISAVRHHIKRRAAQKCGHYTCGNTCIKPGHPVLRPLVMWPH